MRLSTSVGAFAAIQLAVVLSRVSAQTYQQHNLTPDGYYHNLYHHMLAMSAYGDYNTLCPQQTFTYAGMIKNFPNSQRQPWTVLGTFGPTPSGCSGYTVVVPEMNKAVIVFRGNYTLEQTLSSNLTGFDAIGLGQNCPQCQVNAFAARGYMECKAETNDWADVRQTYYESGANGQHGLVFSVTGHGLGGMHAQIAGVDLNNQNVDYYNHAVGAPAVFNAAGAQYYNDRFNGEAGERAIYGNDQYTNYFDHIPAYHHAGTAFYYSGWNQTGGGPNWTICWNEDGDYNATRCRPHDNSGPNAQQDHYYYTANVGQCGSQMQQTWQADQFVARQNYTGPNATHITSAVPSSTSASSSATSSAIITPAAPSVVLAASAYPSSLYVTYSSVSSAISSATVSLSLFIGSVMAVALLSIAR